MLLVLFLMLLQLPLSIFFAAGVVFLAGVIFDVVVVVVAAAVADICLAAGVKSSEPFFAALCNPPFML